MFQLIRGVGRRAGGVPLTAQRFEESTEVIVLTVFPLALPNVERRASWQRLRFALPLLDRYSPFGSGRDGGLPGTCTM